jgi:5-methylcytosine-specific restriction endonuclease McrA
VSRRKRSHNPPADVHSGIELPRDRRGVSSITRDMVMKRDGYCCQECDNVAVVNSGGSEPIDKLEVCYRSLPEDGGNNSFANLVTLCVQCIRKRGLEPVGGPYDSAQWL